MVVNLQITEYQIPTRKSTFIIIYFYQVRPYHAD